MSKILVINSGSATLKFKVFSAVNLQEEISGIVERIGIDQSFLSVKIGRKEIFQKFPAGIKNHQEALSKVVEKLIDILPAIKFVGHRVVHGGGYFSKTTKLDSKIIAKLEEFNKLAPLHNPVNLAGAKASLKLLLNAKQFAVFDTAYYASIPDYASRYALPEKYFKLGIRKYGFHGVSHKFSAIEGAKKSNLNLKKTKIISCHLGSGCSITATKFGQAVDTSMGFTPLEGLMMSTRTGDMDPSIALYLINELKMTTKEVDNLFNKQSGLLGVAGTMDMREILSAAGQKVVGYKVAKKFTVEEKAKAKLALNMFVYDIVRYLGQFTAVMGGVDLIVFTGGIGERSKVIQEMILKQVRFLGRFKVVTVSANEELMIAKEVLGK